MPWGDCTGPWWIGGRAYDHYPRCWGRGRFSRGSAYIRAFPPAGYGYPREFTLEEERGYLEDIAKNLEEELRSVRERIEKLGSGH